jgi:DNA-binding response OmpR family regulator
MSDQSYQPLNRKLLIVEDDPGLNSALYDEFTHFGFTTFKAMNGMEGVQVALKQHPDIILLDMIMPQMDGMATYTEIRHDEWGKTVPIIFLTNLNPNEQMKNAVAGDQNVKYMLKSDTPLETLVKNIVDLIKTKTSTSTQ